MAKYPQWTGQLESALESAFVESGYTTGRVEALINTLGKLDGELVADGLISGDLEAEVVDGQVVIRPVAPLLFDKNGRRIPPRGLVANVCDPNREFHLNQPTLDYGARLARFEGTGLTPPISGADFAARAEELLQRVGQNEQTKNLLKGVHLPVVIPHTQVADLGQTTEGFVTAAGTSYCREFPTRSFTNYRTGELAERVAIVEGGRYDQLLARMVESLVVGIYFPNPLQGYSVNAQREQMATLPERFILSGPLDTALGWVMYPDVLARDFKTPGYDCSAVQWPSSEYSLRFKAYDDKACFAFGACLPAAYGFCSGGLLFLG